MQVDGEVSQRRNKQPASKAMTRTTIGKNLGVTTSRSARRGDMTQDIIEKMQRHEQGLPPTPIEHQMRIDRRELTARQESTERVPSIATSAIGLVGGPLSPVEDMEILEFNNKTWTSTKCRRGSIKRFIANAKSRIGGEFDFYSQQGRNYTEYEIEDYQTVCIAPKGTPIPPELWPEEEL